MIAAVALLLAAGPPLPEAAPLFLALEATPEQVALGDLVEVRLVVEHDARDVYSLPAFDPSPMETPKGAATTRSRRSDLGGGKARTEFELTVVDYATLEPRVPDLTLAVSGPEGARQLSIRGRPLKFRSLVEEEGQPSPERAHHGPKPPVAVKIRSFRWAWILGALALGLAFLVARKRFGRRTPASETPAEAFADDLALERLAALRTDAAWSRGQGRGAIFALSEIVRGYLGARLQFNALDLTSDELVAELRRRRLIGLDLAALIEELRWEDLVKFAKVEPTAEECLAGIDLSESLIRHTRPLRAIPGKAA